MTTSRRTILARLAGATAILSLGLTAALVHHHDLHLDLSEVPLLLAAAPVVAFGAVVDMTAAAHGFFDAQQRPSKTCSRGVSWSSAFGHARRPILSRLPRGVAQVVDGELVSCNWPHPPSTHHNQHGYEDIREAHFIELTEWAPGSGFVPRHATSPRDFLLNKSLELGRGARVAILVHLYVTRHRRWKQDLYEASNDELLWWIGMPNGLWFEAPDPETLIIGRVGRDGFVIWDAATQRVYSP